MERPNRFIAKVELLGEVVTCHVKNTGRCRELLLPGARVIVTHNPSPKRKTDYDLVSVYKGERLFNIDSSAPNRIFREWVEEGGLFSGQGSLFAERRYKDSRFDYYVEWPGGPSFVEVKGVTLEEGDIGLFPDAPTTRGVKHLRGLIDCVKEGYGAFAVFVIQAGGVRHLEPNRTAHPEFALAMREARDAGVAILALDCEVTQNEIRPGRPVEVRL